ncbi:Shedu anti-phage system protein SduA domain-containing protein [Stutzerimonas stutzeri]|uniref:Shedu anti-phage system protein SduA domain-containing protein n=1 Tax=Stutzerimonas stutzeri TaxID=316 RepID=UPI001CFD53D2|nr:Shedu anti-phage system protein SduA domain-containing protein [Stutzerimonas stutzeri]
MKESTPEKIINHSIEPLIRAFITQLMERYFSTLHNYIKENGHLIKSAPGLLLNPDEITVYVGRTHIAVEYNGPEITQNLIADKEIQIRYYDYSSKASNLLEKIIGFEYDPNSGMGSISLPAYSQDFLLPTNRGWDKLTELKWNFSAQNSIMAFNLPSPRPADGEFTRIVNGMFFDADDSGLKTRRIKWLDFFPIEFDGSHDEYNRIVFCLGDVEKLAISDAHAVYPLPENYKYIQLPKINRFIELWGNSKTTEPQITSFLSQSENKFILTMKFGATDIFSELPCEWQSEDRDPIRPDFFVLQPNGYADIVEFKLPILDKATIVGRNNRETFSAWLNSYISQTRVYATYFDDPNNRSWFERKYGFKVYKPRRWLVIGRRSDFGADMWREIACDYRDLEIITFDDLIDGTVVQFYQ